MKPGFRSFAMDHGKRPGFVLLLLGIATGAAAQTVLLLSAQQPAFWDIQHWLPGPGASTSPLPGLLLYTLAGVLFTQGLKRLNVDTSRPFAIPLHPAQPRPPRFGFWITSLGLTWFITVCATQPKLAAENGYALAALWLIGIMLFVASVLLDNDWRAPSARRMRAWCSLHRAELLVMATILVAAFLVRFLDVELHPYSFINDEGMKGKAGVCILDGNCRNFFTVGWSGQPIPGFLPVGISIALFGNTATAVRLVSVITGTLAVLAVYLFTREAFDRKTARVAALLLAVLPVHVHFSRIGVDNIMDSLSTTLVLWLLLRGIKRASPYAFLAAGIVGGLCLYTYPGTRLAPLLGLAALSIFSARRAGFLRANHRRILVFIFAAIVTAAPILGYFSARPEVFFLRMSRENIFQNGVLQNEMQAGSISAAEVLTLQFLKSSLVFIATPAPSNFFNSPRPYLLPLAAVFFMLGLGFVLWRIKDPRHAALFTWFWAAIILGGTITGGPPTSQRMLMSTPALAVITALGVTLTIDAFQKCGACMARLGPVLLLAFVLFVGYTDMHFYFYDYRLGHFFEDPANELSYETRTCITPLGQAGRMYLLADPAVPYLSFANFSFLSPGVQMDYCNDVSREALAALPRDKDVLFIATPVRKADLDLIAQRIPGGAWSETPRRYQPQHTLFYTYKITSEQLETFNPKPL